MLNLKNALRGLTRTCLFAGILTFAAACADETSNVAVSNKKAPTPAAPTASVSPPSPNAGTPTPAPLAASPTPEIINPTTPTPAPNEANERNNALILPKAELIIPVVGVRREDLRDTFNEARSEGRTHEALDIMAPRGATVVAAGDGEIKFFDSVRGGITIYQINREKKLVYYYAHLDRRADNLKEGDFIRQGSVIGYVGDTGNSGAGNYHLHFGIWTLDDPKRHWEGTNINPYPLLK
jgi:peptidoglycan LD-endopeptidase LytH